MMLALVGADGREPALRTWTIGLQRAGVPFTLVALRDRAERSSFLSAFAAGAFQALILADGELAERMRDAEAAELLQEAERRLGIRRLIAYASPTAAHGLRAAGGAGPLDGATARLTESGRRLFPYLRGEVAVDPG